MMKILSPLIFLIVLFTNIIKYQLKYHFFGRQTGHFAPNSQYLDEEKPA